MSTPYVIDSAGDWLVIADGKATEDAGAHRWESESLNGFSIFNNGRDLPLTYRVGDKVAEPIYELREQGVASVGTIGIQDAGILMCGNIREIQQDRIEDLFRFELVTSSNGVKATQAVFAVTTESPVFASTMVGSTLIWSDGRISTIVSYTNETAINVAPAYTDTTPKTFTIKVKAAQAGATWSYLETATMAADSTLVAATAELFTNDLVVGKYVWFQNGWSGKIASWIDKTRVQLEAAPGFAINAQSFWIVDPISSYIVTAYAPVFDESWVGRKITWENCITKEITKWISPTQVEVDSFTAVAAQYCYVENTETYARYEKDQYCNTIGYKLIWSFQGEPRRWGAILKGTVRHGSDIMDLSYPVKSLKTGQQITIYGGGVSGGTLTTTIKWIGRLGSYVRLSTMAMTPAAGTQVVRTDAVSSIVGAEYLQDDGSSILRIKPCQGQLVIYKDTSIWTGSFTGINTGPFTFKKLSIPHGFTLYYPYTLVEVQGQYHFYAGRRGFYTFDTASLLPKMVDVAEFCKDIFFSQVKPEYRNYVWAADNLQTHEVMVQFPSVTQDKGLWFDYLNMTASTTSMPYTAACMVKRPFSKQSEDWFIMACKDGVVVTYGRLDNTFMHWGTKKAIYYRRHASPVNYNIHDYYSLLRSGLSDFGDPHNEKVITSYTPLLSSQTALDLDSVNLKMYVSLFKARNVSEAPVLLSKMQVANPLTEPMLPVYFQGHCIQDEIRVHGISSCDISMRLMDVDGIRTKGHQRRKTDE